jgi:hypothetical protein
MKPGFRASGTALMIGVGLSACSERNDPAAINLKARLIAHWSANTNAQELAGRWRGVLTGGVTVVTSGTNADFLFAGKGQVWVSNATELNFGANRDVSITARIQPLPADTSFGVMSIVDKRQVASITAALGYALHLENGRLGCQLAPVGRRPWKFSDFTSPTRFKAWWQMRRQLVPMTFSSYVAPGPDLRDGRFHNVAMAVERRSSTGGKLYVDGKLVLIFDPRKQAASLANTAPLLIGGHPDTTLDCGFRGRIGDVRLYSRALSAGEVRALAASDH